MGWQVGKPFELAAGAAYRIRRRIATYVAIALALVFGWHAFFGQNGITAYAQKRNESQQLNARIEMLAAENASLKDHVQHLKNDPDTIEMEARRRLHYTRPGEVVYTMNKPTGGSSEHRRN